MSVAAAVVSEHEFRDILAKLERLVNDVNAHVTALFERGNRALRFLPPGLDETLRDALQRLHDLIVRFFAEYAKIALNPGWPFGLRAAASDWTEKVGGPVSSLVGRLAPDQLRVDNYWRGRAAEAYAAILPSQQKALEAIKTTTDTINANLNKAAWGIIAFWAGIVLAVGAFVAELIAEAAAAATVVGAPPAAAAAGVSTAKVIGVVVGCISLFVTFAGTIVDSMTSLNQTLHANAAFPGGKWPRSTTSDFSDGSLSDGDTTDWRIRTDG